MIRYSNCDISFDTINNIMNGMIGFKTQNLHPKPIDDDLTKHTVILHKTYE